jgi:hypothetical protein
VVLDEAYISTASVQHNKPRCGSVLLKLLAAGVFGQQWWLRVVLDGHTWERNKPRYSFVLLKLLAGGLIGQQWLRVVLDEAHTIRNSETQQAKVSSEHQFLWLPAAAVAAAARGSKPRCGFVLLKLLAAGLFGQQWLRVVLDEAHTIRNSETQQAKVRLCRGSVCGG